MKSLWEILVPTTHPDGRPIHLRHHRVWDTMVREISGGLTVMPVTKGQWVSPAGDLFAERMIPVRIYCTREQVYNIVNMSMGYYNQEAILAYKVSDEVILVHRGDNGSTGSAKGIER